ncbi:MAG: PD-(D/E)XK nuclease family protein [Bacillus subtilis]|nr:PD-(D/E)XK nuclease family protein [Bacillus subtilis]
MKTLQISVREIAELLFGSGNIAGERALAIRAEEGTEIHQFWQGRYEGADQKEVVVKTVVEQDGFHIELSGRIDGVVVRDGVLTIEEIKSTHDDLESIDETTYPAHLVQAKLYAYLHCLETQPSPHRDPSHLHQSRRQNSQDDREVDHLQDARQVLPQDRRFVYRVGEETRRPRREPDEIDRRPQLPLSGIPGASARADGSRLSDRDRSRHPLRHRSDRHRKDRRNDVRDAQGDQPAAPENVLFDRQERR